MLVLLPFKRYQVHIRLKLGRKKKEPTTMGINSMFVPGDLTTKLCYTYSNMGTNIHFDGLVLDGNYSAINQTGFDATANSKGINASYVDNISITHCKIRNFLGSGIYTAGCSRQIITDNVCHDNGYLSVPASKNGISLAGWYDNGGPYGLYYDAIVSRNIVHNNHDEGIMFSYQKRILISDNIVHDNGDRGIEGDASFQTTDSGDNVPGDVSIVNNFVYDNATHGITIDSSNNQKIKISGNTVRNCQSYGISVNQSSGAEVKISDNLLFNVGYKSDGNLYHGIQVNADEITVQNNTLNKVGVGSSSPGSGIAISRGLNILVTGNKVSAAQVHGISVNPVNQSAIGTHVNSVIVSSNIINKSKAHGINIGGSMPSNTNYNRIRQITINGNNVFDYNEGNAAHQGYGIIIRSDVNADSVVVNGNTVYEDRATRLGAGAIFFQSTTNGKIVFASVTGNEISNGSDWVALDGYQYITYATVENNSLYGQRIVRGTAPPTTNIWQTGDRVINTAPSAGGYLGWVCIANGTLGRKDATTRTGNSPIFYGGDSMITAQDVFITTMSLMDEESEDGAYTGYPDEYKKKAWPILTLLQAELLPASASPSVITDNTSVFQVDDRTGLMVLPYGLAAHLLLNEDQNRAAYFNNRYDELKRKKKAVITKIKDVYGIAPSEEETPATPTPTEETPTDGGDFLYESPSVWDGGEF
jgi:parallel beta-helix repeat protein